MRFPQKSIFRTHPIWVFMFVLGTTIYAGYLTGKRYLITQRHRPALEVSPEFLHFRTVSSTEELRWRLVVKNTSNQSVTVQDVKTSCDCTEVTPRTFGIGAGESRELVLRIDLSIPDSSRLRSFQNYKSIRLVPVIEGSSMLQPFWELKGQVVVPCILERTTLTFSGMHEIVQGRKGPAQAIRAKLKSTEHVVRASVAEHDGIANVRSQGAEAFIDITPNSDRDTGWFEFPVRLTIMDREGNAKGVQELRVEGEIVPPFTFSPKALSLGFHKMDTRIQERVTVDCSDGEIVDASTLSGDVDVQVEPSAGTHAVVGVSFTVKDLGPQQRSIHLIYKSKSGEVSTATIPIYFSGSPLNELVDRGK